MTAKHDTAIGILETSSIARGMQAADAILKAARVRMVVNRTICPGKYMVLVGGSIDAVQAGIDAGLRAADHTVVDHFVIPHIHPDVFPAINGIGHIPKVDALGVVESFSVASAIEAADAAVKSAEVQLLSIHLAMAIGGKAFVTLTGNIGAVSAAVEAGAAVIARKGLLVDQVVIASPDPDMVREFV